MLIYVSQVNNRALCEIYTNIKTELMITLKNFFLLQLIQQSPNYVCSLDQISSVTIPRQFSQYGTVLLSCVKALQAVPCVTSQEIGIDQNIFIKTARYKKVILRKLFVFSCLAVGKCNYFQVKKNLEFLEEMYETIFRKINRLIP